MADIREHAHTGRHGDSIIFVSTIDEAQDIRTGANDGNLL
jgi:nitrogen regulatory protein PII